VRRSPFPLVLSSPCPCIERSPLASYSSFHVTSSCLLLFSCVCSLQKIVKMQLELLFLVVAVQLFLVSAQVSFSHPTEGEVISGDVPFVLNVAESTSAPYFSQMTNFSLYLLAGTYSSPVSHDVHYSTIYRRFLFRDICIYAALVIWDRLSRCMHEI